MVVRIVMCAQPNLQAAGFGVEPQIGLLQKLTAVELPIVFTVKDPRRADLPIQSIKRRHVAAFARGRRPLDEREQILCR